MLENILLNRNHDYIYIADNQLGIKGAHSTSVSVLLLKELLRFCGFLDGSKASVRVDYLILFRKLISHNTSVNIVCLLNWYRQHYYHIATTSWWIKIYINLKFPGMVPCLITLVFVTEIDKVVYVCHFVWKLHRWAVCMFAAYEYWLSIETYDY